MFLLQQGGLWALEWYAEYALLAPCTKSATMIACSAPARPGCAVLLDALAAAQPALQPTKSALGAKL